MRQRITYTVEEADTSADGKHVRILATADGRYLDNHPLPKHVDTLTVEQAQDLRDDLDDLLGELRREPVEGQR